MMSFSTSSRGSTESMANRNHKRYEIDKEYLSMRGPVKPSILRVFVFGLSLMRVLLGCQSTYSVAQDLSSDGNVESDPSAGTIENTDVDTGVHTGINTDINTDSDTGDDVVGDTGTNTDKDTGSRQDSDTPSEETPKSCEETCVFPVADHVDLTYAVWGEDNIHFYIPKPSWAMAAIQASRMLAYYFSGGLSRTVSPNWFLATALKESFLGCCEGIPGDVEHPSAIWEYQPATENDGCFQIESGTAFVEMQRIFPGHFSSAAHEDVIAGCNVESSALTMAFYNAFAFGMMFEWIDDIDTFFSVTKDPMATETAFSLAYNRGVWSTEFNTAIDACADAADILECVFGADEAVARDHAYAISRYIQDLDAAAIEGRCYDGAVTTQDIADYVDAVLPILAPNDNDNLKERALAAFQAAAKGDSGSFQATFGAVLEVLESAPLEDPFLQLLEWYGVVGPGADYTFSWPDIEDTCEIVIPVI